MISIITAIKNRFDTIELVLSKWCQIEDVCEIIIVDWSSDDPDYLKKHVSVDDRVKVVRVEGEQYHNHCRAKNLGALVSKGSKLLITDSDVSFNCIEASTTYPFEWEGKDLHRFYHGCALGCIGTMFTYRNDFWIVGGCDERFEGWGEADTDLYRRLSSTGINGYPFDGRDLHHLHHSDDLRWENMLVKGKQPSIDCNLKIVRDGGLWSKKKFDEQHIQKDVTIYTNQSTIKGEF